MDLLAGYGEGSSGGEEEEAPVPSTRKELALSAAPEVDTTGIVLHRSKATSAAEARTLLDPSARKVTHNIPYEDLAAPVLGPAHPSQRDGLAPGMRNHTSGYVEDVFMNQYHFDEQYNTFHAMGYAHAPGSSTIVGDEKAFRELGGENVYSAKRRKTTAEKKEEEARKAAQREAEGELDPSAPFTLGERQPWASKAVEVTELTDEQKEYMAKMEAEKQEAASKDVDKRGPVSFFHGKEERDYQGRSWMAAPKEKRKESEYCYLPKRWIHSWSGHTKGVNAIRWFPGMGHLMLSAGLDGKVKIWDVFNSKKCMRTYIGHSKGVKDISFNADGTRFISTGFDKNVRVWDTETGTVLRTINNGKMFHCVSLHPDPAKANVLMTGCQDKKIYQWDLDTGDLQQEYNYHLGPVNSVTFIDGGQRFVTTSDDKTIRVWEFGIPVQIMYIADPSMHAIPTVTMSPDKNWVSCQSQDNQIVSYSTKDGRFKCKKNKTFKGHNTAGYACQINYSPDMKYLLSGDSEGRCFFWEWQHPQKIVRTIKAHDGVCIGAAWHPMESSKVATCGWDGLIKYWD